MPLWAFLAHIRPLFLRCIETEIDSLTSAIDEQSAEWPSRHIRFIKKGLTQGQGPRIATDTFSSSASNASTDMTQSSLRNIPAEKSNTLRSVYSPTHFRILVRKGTRLVSPPQVLMKLHRTDGDLFLRHGVRERSAVASEQSWGHRGRLDTPRDIV